MRRKPIFRNSKFRNLEFQQSAEGLRKNLNAAQPPEQSKALGGSIGCKVVTVQNKHVNNFEISEFRNAELAIADRPPTHYCKREIS